MTDPYLGPAAYIVLGLLSKYGAATSYDLKRRADGSIGCFWNFPRSQLYAEPQRLVTMGLVRETQEEWGRRKRTFNLNPAGQATLENWLSSPAGVPELRDYGLLKLYFIGQGNQGALQQLAEEQLHLHQGRLAQYQRDSRDLRAQDVDKPTLMTLDMGLLYEDACVAFWKRILEAEAVGSSAGFSSN